MPSPRKRLIASAVITIKYKISTLRLCPKKNTYTAIIAISAPKMPIKKKA